MIIVFFGKFAEADLEGIRYYQNCQLFVWKDDAATFEIELHHTSTFAIFAHVSIKHFLSKL